MGLVRSGSGAISNGVRSGSGAILMWLSTTFYHSRELCKRELGRLPG